jgi:hypothetical protein
VLYDLKSMFKPGEATLRLWVRRTLK